MSNLSKIENFTTQQSRQLRKLGQRNNKFSMGLDPVSVNDN